MGGAVKSRGGGIESELRSPPPRKPFWPKQESYSERVADLLANGLPARAVVVAASDCWNGGHEAGPKFFVSYRFEPQDGSPVVAERQAEFDGTHLGYDQSGFSKWLSRVMKVGGAFTVLYRQEAPEEHLIVGLHRIKVDRTLAQLGTTMRRAKRREGRAFEANVRDFLYLLQPHTYDFVSSRGYLDKRLLFMLAKDLGLLPDNAEYKRYAGLSFGVEDVRRFLAREAIDGSKLEDLSELCGQYRRGVLLVR